MKEYHYDLYGHWMGDDCDCMCGKHDSWFHIAHSQLGADEKTTPNL